MGVNDLAEQLEVAKAEMVRLETENAQLRRDLDAGFAESDHLSAKYYQRMRAAEAARDVEHYEKNRARNRANRAEAVIAEALGVARASSVPLGMPEAAFYGSIKREVEFILATYQNGAEGEVEWEHMIIGDRGEARYGAYRRRRGSSDEWGVAP